MRRFETEQDAVYQVAGQLHPLFHVVPEVQMAHLDGSKVRIDMIAVARDQSSEPDGFHRFTMIGVEVKRGYESLRDFNYALKQAIDYRHSVISDRRSKRYQGQTPEFVFLYPDFIVPGGQISDIYERGYYGSIRLAGLFNVGIIREVKVGWHRSAESELEFRVSDTPIWRSRRGWSHGINFGSARSRGAA